MPRSPRIRCELTWSANWGYGATEYHQCRYAATHVIKLPGMGYYLPPDKLFACRKHAATAQHEFKLDREAGGQYGKVYRFRKV